jgi:hypothetical protein
VAMDHCWTARSGTRRGTVGDPLRPRTSRGAKGPGCWRSGCDHACRLRSAAGGGLIPSIDATFGHPSGRSNHRHRGQNETVSSRVLSCQPGRVRGSRPRNRSWKKIPPPKKCPQRRIGPLTDRSATVFNAANGSALHANGSAIPLPRAGWLNLLGRSLPGVRSIPSPGVATAGPASAWTNLVSRGFPHERSRRPPPARRPPAGDRGECALWRARPLACSPELFGDPDKGWRGLLASRFDCDPDHRAFSRNM